jgi:hypothetical protein
MSGSVTAAAERYQVLGQFRPLANIGQVVHVKIPTGATVVAEAGSSINSGHPASSPTLALEVAAVLALPFPARRPPPRAVARFDVPS